MPNLERRAVETESDEKPRFVERGEHELRTQGLLILCAEQAASRARAEDAAGPMRSFIATNDAAMAIVLAAFTVEATLNYVGTLRVAGWSEIERKLSPEQKLRYFQAIESRLRIDNGARPWQSVRHAFEVRNALAHGKLHREPFERELDESDRGPRDDGDVEDWLRRTAGRRVHAWSVAPWQRYCSAAQATMIVSDARAASDEIGAAFGWQGSLLNAPVASGSTIHAMPRATSKAEREGDREP